MDKHYLTPLFAPQSIAVFAGSPDDEANWTKHARALRAALDTQKFSGTLQFVDTHASGTLAELAQSTAHLAIIALPPDEVVGALELAARMACRAALVLSSGIEAREATTIKQIASREGMQLLGPNCLGFQNPYLNLNASAIGPLAKPGPLALISQSGALTAGMLDWAAGNAVGFSHVISLGRNAAVDIAQALDYLAADARTQSIIVYLEGISNARRFMSALRTAAISKPVLVLKSGRQPAGNEAAQTHSGVIVGNDDVFDAALRRAGAVRVGSFVELFSAAKCLASRYRPVGPRLAIITNGGGPGVLAADRVNEINLELGKLTAESVAALKPKLPEAASLSDLIDVTEDATPEHYAAAVAAAGNDPQVDGVLAVCSPRPNGDLDAIAKALVENKRSISKPLLTCMLGDAAVLGARAILNDAGIPTFRTPEAAVSAFSNIASYYRNQRLLQQTPPPLSSLAKPDIEAARLIIESVLAERRKVLTEIESKALLAAFHIPVTNTILARGANEAMMIAAQLGFPVALKIDSPSIVHKSDVQGVALNIFNGTGARDTYTDVVERVRRLQPEATINGVTVQKMAGTRFGREIYIGLVTEPPFGPVIVFGAGGTMIELLNDRAMELPPLNQFLARRLIERSRVSKTLGEWRGAPAISLEALEQVLLRVSEMVCELPQLREMDINPIIVDDSGAIAVDARIVIESVPPGVSGRADDYPHLAILPYPAHHEQEWPLPGGGHYTIRPVHPDDAQMLQRLVQDMSPESRFFRFVSTMRELPPAMLARFTLIDYDREMALVAVVRQRTADEDGEIVETERMVGSVRYVTNADQSTCEFSVAVADDFAGKGLGSRLMESIMGVAREKGLSEIQGLVLAKNHGMLKLMRSLGFAVAPYTDDPDFMLVTHPL